MAAIAVKTRIQEFMGRHYIYYRPLYAIFATLSLVLILWFQFSIESPRLISTTPLAYLPGILAALTGLIIMVICINKYFYELSGLQAIQQPGAKNTLQQSGLHKHVRHPLYLGTLLFVWGLVLIFPFLNNLTAAAIITAYVFFWDMA
jgi:protein-S-isoprenylcysteine O-methyltransferase Ste14